jgi:hypothetical protein
MLAIRPALVRHSVAIDAYASLPNACDAVTDIWLQAFHGMARVGAGRGGPPGNPISTVFTPGLELWERDSLFPLGRLFTPVILLGDFIRKSPYR